MVAAADVSALRGVIRSIVLIPSTCVPPGAVLLTMAGGEQASALRPLQFALVSSELCLMRRTVSFTWNHTDAFGSIVPATHVQTLPSYFEMNWIKWHLISTALREARVVFFADADTLLMRNPFTASAEVAAYASTSTTASCSAATPKLFHQWEGPGSNPLNGGQLLTCQCSRAAILDVLTAQPSSDDEAFKTRLDQEIAYEALWKAGHKLSQLPVQSFGGNCWWPKGWSPTAPWAPPWCDLITFHAHCTGTLREKIERMRLVLSEVRGCHPHPTLARPSFVS